MFFVWVGRRDDALLLLDQCTIHRHTNRPTPHVQLQQCLLVVLGVADSRSCLWLFRIASARSTPSSSWLLRSLLLPSHKQHTTTPPYTNHSNSYEQQTPAGRRAAQQGGLLRRSRALLLRLLLFLLCLSLCWWRGDGRMGRLCCCWRWRRWWWWHDDGRLTTAPFGVLVLVVSTRHALHPGVPATGQAQEA